MVSTILSIRRLLPVALGGMLAFASHAQAHGDRPWLSDRPQLSVLHATPLPQGGGWRAAAILADHTVVAGRPTAQGGPLVVSVGEADRVTPFPSDAWNDPSGGSHFTAPEALATDDGGDLWVLDNTETGQPSRLVHLDGRHHDVIETRALPANAAIRGSHFVALAVHRPFAYLADQGAAALVAIDLRSMTARRFFSDDPSVKGRRPMVVAGKTQTSDQGLPLARDVSIMALDPRGAWLFSQPPAGPLYRLSTALLTDSGYSPIELEESMTQWRDTPTLGGLAVGDDGTLYMTDIAAGRILSFDTERLPHILLQDRRLVQAGQPVPDGHGGLYIPTGDRLLHVQAPPKASAKTP